MREVKIPFGKEAISEYFTRYGELDVKKMERFLKMLIRRQVDIDKDVLKWQVRYVILPVVMEKLQEKKVPSELVVMSDKRNVGEGRLRRKVVERKERFARHQSKIKEEG